MIYISNPTDSIAVLCVLVLNHYVWLEIIRINRYPECKYIFGVFFSLIIYMPCFRYLNIKSLLFHFCQKVCPSFCQILLVFSENECYSIFVGLFLSRNIQKGLSMIVYRKKYDKTCKTLRPIKSAMWWVIYLQNKTLIQIKKKKLQHPSKLHVLYIFIFKTPFIHKQ